MFIVTDKTIPCTHCGYRVKIDQTADIENGHRVYNFRCKKCNSTFAYLGSFIDDILANKAKL